MDMYTTGQAAKVLGVTREEVAKMVDKGVIEGTMYTKSHWRRSERRISAKALADYVKCQGGQKKFLGRKVACLKRSFAKASRRGDIFRRAEVSLNFQIVALEEAIATAKKRGKSSLQLSVSADVLTQLFADWESAEKCLGSLEDLRGVARTKGWATAFRDAARIFEQHKELCIANSKKARGLKRAG